MALDVVDSGVVKGFLSLATGALSLVGAFDAIPLKIGLVTAALAGLGKGIPSILKLVNTATSKIPKLISTIKGLAAITAADGIGAGFAALTNISSFANALRNIGIYAVPVAAAIGAITIAVKALDEEANQQAALETYQESLSAYQENQKAITELQRQGSSLNENEKIRLEYLKLQTTELQKQKDSSLQNVYGEYGLSDESVSVSGYAPQTKSDRTLSTLKEELDSVESLSKANSKLREEMKEDPSLYKKNTAQIKANNEEIENAISEYSDLYSLLQVGEENGTLTESQEEALKLLDELNSYNADNVYDVTSQYDELSDSLDSATTAATELKTALESITNEGDVAAEYGDIIQGAVEDAAGSTHGTNEFWTAAEGILSSDWLSSINYDFETAYARMQELEEMTGNSKEAVNSFYSMLSSHQGELSEFGVEVSKGADGLWQLSGIDSSNIDSVADALGIMPEYLSAMIDAASKWSNVQFWSDDLDKTVESFAKTSGVIDETTGDVYLYKDALQEVVGLSGSQWSQYIEYLESIGYKFIDDASSASEFAKQLLACNSALGEVGEDGTIKMDLTSTLQQLLELGYSADDAKQKIVELREEGGVDFEIKGKIEVDAETTEYNNKLTLAKKLADEVGEPVTTYIDGDSSGLQQSADTAKAEIHSVEDNWMTTFDGDSSITQQNAKNAESAIKNVPDNWVTTFTGNAYGLLGTIQTIKNKISSLFSAKAEGGESEGGLTLVNEEGPELIYGQGRAFIAGNGLPTITTLKKGDYVYTAEETKKILKNKRNITFASRASGSSGESAYDTLKDKFDTASDTLEHELKMLEYSNADTSSRLSKIKAIQQELHSYADQFRSIGSEEALKSVRELQEEWWEYRNDYLDIIKETHDETVAVMEHELMLSQKNGASEISQIAQIEAIQQELHEQAEYWRTIDTQEAKEMIRELQEEWWSWEEEIESIYESISEKREEVLNKDIEKLEAQQSALEWYSEKQQEAIDEKISALEEEKEALEERNNAEEESIRLQELEEALANAKANKLKVYRAGLGFVYESDADSIAEAQNNLDEYEREQSYQAEIDLIEEKIEAYENEKDAWQDVVDSYRDQQDKLETEMTLGMTMEEYILSQRIENIESFGNAWQNVLDEIIDKEQELQEIEEGTWTPTYEDVMTSGNLSALSNGQILTPSGDVQTANVDSNGKLQNNVAVGSIVKLNGRYWKVTGGTAGNYTSSEVTLSDYDDTIMSQSKLSALSENQILTPNGDVVTGTISAEGKLQTSVPIGSVLKKNGRYWKVTGGSAGAYTSQEVQLSDYNSYATGSGYIPYSQLAKINENGSELIIPPGLNYLYKGTGIVPHTLADNISEIGKMGVSGIKEFISDKINSTSNNHNYNFDQLVLPNVKNAEDFVNELKQLKNFKNIALQKSYIRG